MAEKKSAEELRDILIQAVIREAPKHFDMKIPKDGRSGSFYFHFSFPGSVHDGMFEMRYVDHRECYCLRASVLVGGSDRMISHHLFWGSRQECIDWIQDEGRFETLRNSYLDLCKSADDKL